MRKYILTFFILLRSIISIGQEYNYVHYSTKDGLAGSTVYSTCQDKSGFIWFATEYGLSRFDGKNFKNFTIKDGLPENDVIKVFTDSKDRVWIGTFSNELCYYQNGTIYNKKNSALINKIKLQSEVTWLKENKNNVLICDQYSIYLINSKDSVTKIEAAKLFPQPSNFTVVLSNNVYYFFPWAGTKEIFTIHPDNTVSRYIPAPEKDIRLFYNFVQSPYKGFIKVETNDIDTKSNFINTNYGCWEIDLVNKKLGEHFLSTEIVNSAYVDRENNLWFCTFGNGIFKLPAARIRNIVNQDDHKEVAAIQENNSKIISGNNSQVFFIDENKKMTRVDYNFINKKVGSISVGKNVATSIYPINKDITFIGFDAFLLKINNNKVQYSDLRPIKSICKIDNNNLIVATARGVFKVRTNDLVITDTLWNERATRLLVSNNNYYIGTLHGLYEIHPDKTFNFLGKLHNSLSRRITGLTQTADGTIWVATSDAGITGYKAGKIICNITDSNGLSTNICRSIFVQHSFLWVCTIKGLNKIDLSKANYPITKYGIADGMPSDVINTIYVQGDTTIWIGTPAGISYFTEKDLGNASICNLVIEAITVSGKKVDSLNNIHLKYNENNITFEYSGVSIKAAGEIAYIYRLKGLDTSWESTRSSNIAYPTLPSGNYEMQLYAINKFGKKSDVKSIRFTIATPFWKTLWFWGLIGLILLSTIWYILAKRFKRKQQRLEEKNKVTQQIAALEQLALQAQMNPHFIFNCLNSIQQFIMLDDKEKANKYLTQFATLIRSTFENSGKKNISLSEEINYLNQYIQLEQLRYADDFSYAINIDPTIEKDFIKIPAMLLQPYVENALRHGIRNKTTGDGKLEINFSQDENYLKCVIKDNGIGRKKAEKYKSDQFSKHQSKGTAVTEKRIELLNIEKENKIEVTTVDLINNNNEGIGTEVFLKLPLK